MPEKGLDAEVGQRRPEEDRADLSSAHLFLVEGGRRPVQKLDVVAELSDLLFRQIVSDRAVVKRDIRLRTFLRSLLGIREQQHLPGLTVEDAPEPFARSDGPVHRTAGDSQLVLDLIRQLERVPRVPVHLVDKGENRDVAACADLEKLSCLRLDALRPVNDHHRGVRRHQRPVGILREILMARRIQNIDAETVIVELKDG